MYDIYQQSALGVKKCKVNKKTQKKMREAKAYRLMAYNILAHTFPLGAMNCLHVRSGRMSTRLRDISDLPT